MSYRLLLVFTINLSMLYGAPMLLMPIPWMAQSTEQIVLQKQLMELQALQQMTAQAPLQMNNEQEPIVILLPQQEAEADGHTNERLKIHKENDHKTINTKAKNEDDLNSIIIDAASETSDTDTQTLFPRPQRAILLIPNARLSIGGIISAIPWLPIEINVPDTIAWAYNGIASGIGSIISIIGRPFQGIPGAQTQPQELKSMLQQIQSKQNMFRPIVMMPIDGPVLPIQV